MFGLEFFVDESITLAGVNPGELGVEVVWLDEDGEGCGGGDELDLNLN